MNRIFTHILKAEKAVAKYLVFSLLFVFSIFFGMTTKEVSAANTDFPYSNGDAIVTGTGACTASGLSDGKLSYVLKSGNYDSSSPCVAYTFPDGSGKISKLFYIEADDDSVLHANDENLKLSDLQTVQFTISSSDVGAFTHIAIYEAGYTLGSTVSYDLYSSNGSGFTYLHVLPADEASGDRKWTQETFYAASGIDKGNFTNGTTLTFSYALRNPKYGLNSVYINFYNGENDGRIKKNIKKNPCFV